jgi:DNA invertase Pin-like site-specific DNA recombinase
MQVLAYVRVSTEEQSRSGAGIEAQKAAIARECKRRGWKVVEVIEDLGYSAKDLRRPGIQLALERLERGDARALVVSKLDRLSRSLLDFTGLMARAQKEGWALVALDCGIDSSSPAGEAMVNVLATFAQFERRLIGQRTKEAIEERRRRNPKWGRPSKVPAAVEQRIKRERKRGRTLAAIADGLNRDDVATAGGGRQWWPETVRAVLRRQTA